MSKIIHARQQIKYQQLTPEVIHNIVINICKVRVFAHACFGPCLLWKLTFMEPLIYCG